MQCRAILSQIAGGPPDEPTSRSTGCISDFNSNSSITFFCILSRLSLTQVGLNGNRLAQQPVQIIVRDVVESLAQNQSITLNQLRKFFYIQHDFYYWATIRELLKDRRWPLFHGRNSVKDAPAPRNAATLGDCLPIAEKGH